MTDDPLKEWRDTIDNIDGAIVALLAERFKTTRKVGLWKAANDIPAVDAEREKAQVARFRTLASAANLDPDFLERFLRIIIDEVVSHHRAVRTEEFEAPDPL